MTKTTILNSERKKNMPAINVTTSPTSILSASPSRTGFVIVNLSDTTVYVAPRDDVSASEDAYTGIQIKAGKSMSVSAEDINKLKLQQQWYAIHAGTGNKAVSVETL